jgi:5-oxoprolinase (ATP-hydrolysing)
MGTAPGDSEALLAGCLTIADERMADAIRGISVRRGYDPAEHALVAFGGAGGQHACAVAAKLGMDTVILPPAAGLLSAVGLGAAVLERFAPRQVQAPLAAVASRVPAWLEALRGEAITALGTEGIAPDAIEIRQQRAELRRSGQEATLEVEVPQNEALEPILAECFAERYRAAYGYPPPERPLELVTLRVVASEPRPEIAAPQALPATREVAPHGTRRAFLGGDWQQIPTFDLASLAPGDRFVGPALVFDPHATLVVEARWSARVTPSRAVVVKRGDFVEDKNRPQTP